MSARRIRRFAVWLLFNGGLAALVVVGPVGGDDTASNVLKFWLWAALLMNAFVMFGAALIDRADLEGKDVGRSAPQWLALFLDGAIVTTLAACGWFGYATITAVAAVMEQAAMGIIENRRNEATPEAPL